MSNVGYIIDHVNEDLAFQPEFRQEIVKTLLALLKIRKNENYGAQGLLILTCLESRLDRTSRMRKEAGEKSPGLAFILETKKAALMVFPALTEKEEAEIREYLEELVPKKEETLGQFISQELGLNPSSREINDPDRFQDPKFKTIIAGLAMFQSGNLENFEFNLPENATTCYSQVSEIIKRYYCKRGYEIEGETQDSLLVGKEQEKLLIYVSIIFENRIMISVAPFPREVRV